MDTKDKIFKAMKDTFKVQTVDDTTSQQNCEEWDSINHLNLVVELEEIFDIELEPEDISAMVDFVTVKKIIDSKI